MVSSGSSGGDQAEKVKNRRQRNQNPFLSNAAECEVVLEEEFVIERNRILASYPCSQVWKIHQKSKCITSELKYKWNYEAEKFPNVLSIQGDQ